MFTSVSSYALRRLSGRRRGGFAFFTALFLSCSARLRHSVFAKAKIQNILGKAAGGRRRTDSHVAARGFTEHHLAVPTPTPLALGRVEGSRTSSGCRRVYPCCSQRSRGRSFSGLSWKHDALGKALGWEGCLASPTLSLPSLYPS